MARVTATPRHIPAAAMEEALAVFDEERRETIEVGEFTVRRTAAMEWARLTAAGDGLGAYIWSCRDVHLYGACRHERPCND